MANQMIALGVRGPQIPDLGVTSARMANMMANTAVAREKQNAVQRANEFRRLAQSGVDITTPEGFNQLSGLDPEGAAALRKSALETKAKNAEYAIGFLGSSYEQLSKANTPEEAVAIGGMLKEAYPEFAANVDSALSKMPSDPSQFASWRTNTNLSALKSAERIKFDLDELTTELAIGVKGQPLVVTRGGLKAPTVMEPRSLIPGPQTPTTPRTGKVEVEPSVPVDGGVGGPYTNDTADILDGIVSAQNDRDYQDALALVERANPDMVAALRRTMPRFDPTRIKGIRAEFSRAFGGQAGAPLVAGDRGGVGGPDEGYVEAPTPFRLKDPMQSPTPGIYNVSPGQVRGTSQAEKTGQEEATRLSDLRKALPKAKGALGLATKQLDRDLADIDYVLRSPYREMVIGNVEGRFPAATSLVNVFRSGGQDAQNVQDRLDKINASSVVKHLQEMRDASPQGSSLFGQVTEYEDRLVAALAGLKQTQDEATFDRALRDYRNVLVEMRRNLPQVFNDTYGEIGAKETVRAPTNAPKSAPTISDVEYLRRNKNKPNVVNGFRRHFGEEAYKTAMGVR